MEIIATIKELRIAELLVEHDYSTPNYFRVNSSHMEIPALVDLITKYSLNPKLNVIPLYIDLQGAKLRIDRHQTPIKITLGETLYLKDATLPSLPSTASTDKSLQIVNVNAMMLKLIREGTDVAIDDGRLGIRITGVFEGYATAIVTKEGELRPGKGFNLRPHPIVHKELSERDTAIVNQTKHFPFVRYALSFACLPEEVNELKMLAGKDKFVAVKLEMAMDKDRVLTLAGSADEMWICRGDLTVQVGSFRGLARYYADLMRDVMPTLAESSCRMIMAGEVMEHMCESPEPTRSEVCHIADLMSRGFDGIVVSDETAFGKFPVEVVKTFKEIVKKD